MTRNVVFICLDTVRKDYFEDYAPRLQALSDTSFVQCRAASNWSLPSHASIVTGDLPYKHGIHPKMSPTFSELSEEETFLGDLDGFAKLGVSANKFAGSPFEFNTFFDCFFDYSNTKPFQKGLSATEFSESIPYDGVRKQLAFLATCLRHDHSFKSLANGLSKTNSSERLSKLASHLPFVRSDDGASTLTQVALDQIRDYPEPFFLFMNFMDAHVPHRPLPVYEQVADEVPPDWHSDELSSEAYLSRDRGEDNTEGIAHYREIYRRSIAYLDTVVADFVRDVQAATEMETTFVITADHGENLGYPADENLIGHNSMSEALLHTPCSLVNPPDSYPAEESRLFSHLAFSTLVPALANDRSYPEAMFEGDVVAETIRAGGIDRSDRNDVTWFDRMARCLYRDGAKFEWDSHGTQRECELRVDRPSWQQVVAEDIDTADFPTTDRFEQDIQTYLERCHESGDVSVDPTTSEQLENLGYL